MQKRGETSIWTKIFAGIGVASFLGMLFIFGIIAIGIFLLAADVIDSDSSTDETVKAPVSQAYVAGLQCQYNCYQENLDAYQFWRTEGIQDGATTCSCLDSSKETLASSQILVSNIAAASVQTEEEFEEVKSNYARQCQSGCRAQFDQTFGYTYNSLYNPSQDLLSCTCKNSDTNEVSTILEKSVASFDEEQSKAARVAPYIDPIETSNFEFRAQASQITSDCPSNNKACETNAIYRYVVESLKYRNDPISQIVQTPSQTVRAQAGDCEDFTILMNTLLESIGIETAVVLTPSHAYSVACGVDTASLEFYAQKGVLDFIAEKNTKDASDFSVVESNRLYRVIKKPLSYSANFGGYVFSSVPNFDYSQTRSAKIKYKINAPVSVNVYFLESLDDVERFKRGDSYRHFERCMKEGRLQPEGECENLPPGSVMLVQHAQEDGQQVDLAVDLEKWYEYGPAILPDPVEITTYDLDNRECVVLDGTAGPYGYPGFDANLEASKTVVTTVGRQVWEFNN